MKADEEARLLRLAEAIGDADSVDWQAENEQCPDLSAAMERLRRIEAVASGFRSVRPTDSEDMAPSEASFSWGHLQVQEKLGGGSFGEVYRATDPVLQRDVALKLRRPGPSRNEESGRRFIEEARRLARIRHDNVIAVHGADLHDGRVGLWTELIEGETLELRLNRDGPLGVHEALSVGLDLCRALAAVHAAGLIHGDVKAANVVREKGGRVVLTDFGSGTEDGAETAAFGSPGSAAPEVLLGSPPRPESDIFSLGVLLFKLVSGKLPCPGESIGEIREAGLRGEFLSLRDLRPEIPATFIAVVERALDLDPQARFSTAGDMERALTRVFDAPSVGKREHIRTGWWHRFAHLGAAALIVILAVAVYLIGSRMREPAGTRELIGESAVEEPGLEAVVSAVPAVDPPEVDTEVTGTSTNPLLVTADLFRGGDERMALDSGSSVRPGDQLYLELETDEQVHLYILNADREGDLFVLFPLPDMDLANPLPAGRHRLPGRLSGVPQEWQITSAGGTETFLVVASRARQVELEGDLTALRAATGLSRRLGLESGNLRGIGGVADSIQQPEANGMADQIHQEMTSRREREGDVWVWRIELSNPVL